MEERNTLKQQQQPGYDGLCNYAQKITSCFGLDGKAECGKDEADGVEGKQDTMPNMPNLNSLGKLCSSSRSHSVHRVNRVRVKRKSSVKRMSIIEDGHVAEVLYLIPKQYMEQFPFLNPDDYYLSERLNDVTTGILKLVDNEQQRVLIWTEWLTAQGSTALGTSHLSRT
ncbi:hypothetical protein CRENBAI_016056 [Crenichthys baileyi]|uniref:Uncharacterized protein n=1 Tax=Crenichthys baileyi TaxID=28760 RepID=A0AAV9RRH3_9TELE